MAKKVKGKQRDQVAAVHPSAAGHDPASSATPKHMMSRLDTTSNGFPGAPSPQHTRQELGMSSQAGDTWGAPGGWGPQDAEQGDNGGWGTEAREAGSWGPAGTGTETHASPATGVSPMPGLWGQDAAAASTAPPPPPPEQSSWANPNLLSAALGAIGFGAQPAANAGATPTLKKKSTLKKSPPAAAEASLPHGIVSSPASRHVAFGATSLYSPTTAAPPPAPPAPPAPPPPSSFASQKAAAASRAMHSRNQTYGGWESGFGAPTAPQPGFGRSQSAYPAAAAAAPAAIPQGAWTKWAKEAENIGRPRVATTIAASVPTASVAQHAASAAAGHRAATLAQQNAHLQSLLSNPMHSNMHAQPMHRRQASEPTYPSAGVEAQDWSAWGHSAQPVATHHKQKHHKSHRPQQMQHSDSWGNDWQDSGGGGGGGGAGGGWGSQDNNTGYADTWNAQDSGGWDGVGGGGSGWGTAAGGGEWDANGGGDGGTAGGWGGAAGEQSGRGRSGRKKERDDGGWGSSKGDKGRGHKAHNEGGWGQWDGGRHDTIHEEEEEEYNEDEEENGYDDLDDMYTDPEDDYNDRHKVRADISYQYQSPTDYGAPAPPAKGFGRPQPATTLSPIAFSNSKPQGSPMLPSPEYSKTMNIAAGRTTTVFELAPPRQGLGENTFASSNGAALQTAQRALYSRQRLAKNRIFWAFNPEKDPRVASLMRWIQAMSNGLATIGLQKFIETGQRGALITNADYRVSGGPGGLTQPSFDWVPLEQLRWTYDKVLQESVVCYKPSSQVVVFIFLLSKTGNSMAMWRRKLTVPETVRAANKDAIRSAIEGMDEEKKVVFVDQMPSPKFAPPEPQKKRGFWRKLFGLKAKKA